MHANMQPNHAMPPSHSHLVTLSPCHRVRKHGKPFRRLVEIAVFFLGTLLLFRAIGAEPYGVPTGSMAPALFGNHRAITCPRCGYPVHVGFHDGKREARTAERPTGFCPNCGCADLHLEQVSVSRGDHLLVNKTAFDWRRPRRWEMAVFRCPAEAGKVFVKRVIGLPGENVELHGGDVYIDGQLARKSLADLRALRILVFDNNYQPSPDGWQSRWEGPAELKGPQLELDATRGPTGYRWLVYRNWQLDENKERPLLDEYSYNGGDTARSAEPVHDFMMECDLEVVYAHLHGFLALAVTDGSQDVIAELPVGAVKTGTRLGPCRPDDSDLFCLDAAKTYRTAPQLSLTERKRYHLELAFVDRRVTLAIDGHLPFPAVDLPAPEDRHEVTRPVKIGAKGVEVRVHNFRLYRDVHYTDAGRHGTYTPVPLGPGEYFVLGDNSPNSDDSRFWSDADGRPLPVPEASFLGKPFLVHMPSRIARWDGFGRHWEFQGIDWGRIHWIR